MLERLDLFALGGQIILQRFDAQLHRGDFFFHVFAAVVQLAVLLFELLVGMGEI